MPHCYLSLCMGGGWSAGWIETSIQPADQNCAPSWTYLRDCTGIQGQQNIKNYSYPDLLFYRFFVIIFKWSSAIYVQISAGNF